MHITTKIYNTLKEASSELKKLKDEYFIIGASALVLSGVEIDTSDIDILVSNRDADYLKEVWTDKLLKNQITKDNELFLSNFSRYNFGELDIEIMGDLKVCKNNIWIPLSIQDYNVIDLGDLKIKIPTIEEQKKILYFFGRRKDIEKIRLIKNANK